MNLSRNIRIAAASLTLSAAGLIGLAVHEGYVGTAYIPIPGDVPTIGFGSTRDVKMGDTTNPVQALKRLGHEVNSEYEEALRSCVKVPLNQKEFDIYVSHAYNVGASAFCKSTIVKRLNAEDYVGACNAILMWKYASGKDCSVRSNNCYGLWKRRLDAHEQCLDAQPEDQ